MSDLRLHVSAYTNLEWAALVDTSGIIIASTEPEVEGTQLPNDRFFSSAKLNPAISNPEFDNGRLDINLMSPLKNDQGHLIYFLLLHFRASQLEFIIGDYTNLGQTGETLLGVREGENITFLTTLRFPSSIYEENKIPVNSDSAKPMLFATSGLTGTVIANDYNNREVLASYMPVKGVDWGLVIKQDTEEVFSGVNQIRTSLLISSFIIILIATLVLIPTVQSFIRPLNLLQEATKQISSGNLDVKIPISQFDEVGQLAESFNNMVAQLNVSRENLEKINKELSSFSYVISHDLKAPLRGISSISNWLIEDLEGKIQIEHQEQLHLLSNRVQRMDSLINDLLDYSRIGRVLNPKSKVYINSLLTKIIDSIEPPENIEIDFSSDLPTLITDELHLQQVFQNLITNAVKFHPGPKGLVEITCRELEDMWEFAVKDDGLGIDPRYHQRIFEMFQTLDNNLDVDSTGIGLALVRKIVEENGGTVRVESKGVENEGSTFYFTWPREKRSD